MATKTKTTTEELPKEEEARIGLFEDDDVFEEFEIDQVWDVKEDGKDVTQQWEDDWDDDDVNDDFSLQLRRELESHTEKKKMTTLSDDIICKNIFISLPAKQLAEMRSLSKHWKASLSHPNFIKSHLNRSISNSDGGILLVFNADFYKGGIPFTAYSCRSCLQLTDVVNRLVDNMPLCKGYFSVIGSVNGLICYYYASKGQVHIHIWNPSLSALLRLPPFITEPPSGVEYLYGFGFDPETDDYKVVKLISPLQYNLSVNMSEFPVEVYSMKRGSWQVITSNVPFKDPQIYSQNEKVCVDGLHGHLHWLGHTGDVMDGDVTDKPFILEFDLSLETFNDISFPSSIQDDDDRNNALCWITGKLSLMSYKHGECQVWVMDQYGVADSWVRNYVFPADFGIWKPLGVTLNNEFLFETQVDRGLLNPVYDLSLVSMYDPVASKVKILSRYDYGKKPNIVPYVESLVWVEPAKRGIKNKEEISKPRCVIYF